jgi:hypothetical protein
MHDHDPFHDLPIDAYTWSAQDLRETLHDRPKIISIEEAIAELAPYIAASEPTAKRMLRRRRRRAYDLLNQQPFRVRNILRAEARALGARLYAPSSADEAARVLAHLAPLEIAQLHVLLSYRLSHLQWLADTARPKGQCLLLVDPVWRMRFLDHLENHPLFCTFVYTSTDPRQPPFLIEPLVTPPPASGPSPE